jgi:hypothetical protein
MIFLFFFSFYLTLIVIFIHYFTFLNSSLQPMILKSNALIKEIENFSSYLNEKDSLLIKQLEQSILSDLNKKILDINFYYLISFIMVILGTILLLYSSYSIACSLSPIVGAVEKSSSIVLHNRSQFIVVDSVFFNEGDGKAFKLLFVIQTDPTISEVDFNKLSSSILKFVNLHGGIILSGLDVKKSNTEKVFDFLHGLSDMFFSFFG